ncbi:amino acid ABC transporter permease [Paludibacterium paludis]|uniref:ABC transporter permease n=1 Tax=Paludibacterium paludis TaxID=1225769 RepID=A0A918NY78_9NEIS|nr:amino acid ABC transporter permease [Paludibacterium paludis]GGY06429.1 ABC transporter permease [Paludibacterium paludis]
MTPPAWLGQGWLPARQLAFLADGLALTATLSLLVCVAATFLGTALAAAAGSRVVLLRYPARAFVLLHRNTPLMVQLLLWYFGAPGLLPEKAMFWLNTPHTLETPGGVSLSWPSFEVLAAFLALTFYAASFIAKEVEAGLAAVASGQREAARALGLDAWQAFRWVVLPQALAVIRRPLIGQYTGVIKNTSLTMAIGVAELSYRSRQVESETLLAFQAFAVATMLYLALILAWQWLGRAREPQWRGGR